MVWERKEGEGGERGGMEGGRERVEGEGGMERGDGEVGGRGGSTGKSGWV